MLSLSNSQVLIASSKIIAKSLQLIVEHKPLTEEDLMKSIYKMSGRSNEVDQLFTEDIESDHCVNKCVANFDFASEFHELYLKPSSKIKHIFPKLADRFLYVTKFKAVGQTELRFTVRLDHSVSKVKQKRKKLLRLHCPDNHKVEIIGHLRVCSLESCRVSRLETIPFDELAQLHNLMLETSKEVYYFPYLRIRFKECRFE